MSNPPEDQLEVVSSSAFFLATSPILTTSQPSGSSNASGTVADADALHAQEGSDLRVPDLDHDWSAASSSIPIVKPLRTLTSFVPILKQIQGSLVLKGNVYNIVGHPTKLEWTRLQAYARTVEELFISDNDPQTPKIPDVAYFFLGQLQGSAKPLFPSLSRLRIASTTSTSIPHLFLFVSPFLKEVELTGLSRNTQTTLTAFLQRASKETPLITLILDSVYLVSEVIRLIANCRSLKTLEIRNVKEHWDASSLSNLAYLPWLKRFRVDATHINGSYIPILDSSIPHKLWSSLSDFQFTGAVSTLQEIMSDRTKMTSLKTLHVELVGYLPEPHRKKLSRQTLVHQVFQSISPPDTLSDKITSLTIIFKSIEKSCETLFDALPYNSLAIIFELRNLEHFQITGIQILKLERVVSDLNSHWSKIRTLHFPVTNYDSISLSTALALAQSCPDLTSLQVPIEIPQNGPPVTLADVLSHQLKFLSVGSPKSDLGNQADRMLKLDYVARSLVATFPNLQDIQTHQGYQEKYWIDVGRLVKLCQDAVEFSRKRDASSSLQDGI